jgi:hypothetical protein
MAGSNVFRCLTCICNGGENYLIGSARRDSRKSNTIYSASYSKRQVAIRLRSSGYLRARATSKWRRKGETFVVDSGGRPGYFTFQFDPMTGWPKSVIAMIIQAPPNTDGWRFAFWLVWANPRLANRRPVDVLDRNPEQVVEAAKGTIGLSYARVDALHSGSLAGLKIHLESNAADFFSMNSMR